MHQHLHNRIRKTHSSSFELSDVRKITSQITEEDNGMKMFVLFAVLAFSSAIYAQQELVVADGSSSKTYQTIFAEMTKVIACPEITFKEIPSSGALENLDKVISNEANACFVHSDVLAYRAKTEDLSNLKTLLALFSEDVHFVALTDRKRVV